MMNDNHKHSNFHKSPKKNTNLDCNNEMQGSSEENIEEKKNSMPVGKFRNYKKNLSINFSNAANKNIGEFASFNKEEIMNTKPFHKKSNSEKILLENLSYPLKNMLIQNKNKRNQNHTLEEQNLIKDPSLIDFKNCTCKIF